MCTTKERSEESMVYAKTKNILALKRFFRLRMLKDCLKFWYRSIDIILSSNFAALYSGERKVFYESKLVLNQARLRMLSFIVGLTI